MILLLALLFLFRQYGTSAAPVTASFPDLPAYNTTLFTRDDPADACPGRSVWDIVWSCMATTFAVTWVSVHPNVPFLEESSWHLLKRRMFLMCLALLVPEVMIIWAFKQWRGSVMIMETVNKARLESGLPRWTMTHAHFLQMGGFKLNYLAGEDFRTFDDNTYRTSKKGIILQECFLSFSNLRKLLNKRRIDFPEATVKEIEDRSKSDALSKGVALLQISWFLLQLIARAHQHLDITEIELTTAALAGLNSVMYLFWWNKPFDVRCPIVIRTKELERQLAEAENEEGTGEAEWSFHVDEFDLKAHLMTTAWESMTRVLSTIRAMPASFIGCLRRAILSPTTPAPKNNPETPAVRRCLESIWTCYKSAVTKLVYGALRLEAATYVQPPIWSAVRNFFEKISNNSAKILCS